jgi:DNA-binding CsgD family transcriptional regulator
LGKSDLLRVQEVRDAYRLIGECRDLGSDATLWHGRMLEGLCRLIGAPVGTGGGGRWIRPQHDIEPTLAVDVGLDSSGRQLYAAYMHEFGPSRDPIFEALKHVSSPLVVCTRRQLVSDAVWYRSAAWNDYRRPLGIDDQLTSIYRIFDGGAISVIALVRARGEREFSPRERRLLRFFHEELRPLIGRSLVSPTEPSSGKLSPRLRQTLACLLEGDSEKQVAARLSLSAATIHQYVTALYRHFDVSSRAQLLANVIRRVGRDGWSHPLSSEATQPPDL